MSNSNVWFQIVAFNEPFGHLLYYVLQAAGHDVGLTIANLSDIVERVRGESPDVLVIELDQDGYAMVAVERLQSQADTAAIPIVAVSSEPELLALARKSLGIRFTLRAPWDLKEAFALFAEVASAIRGTTSTKSTRRPIRQRRPPAPFDITRKQDAG
ncbi:MAG TPA: hypothetical protein VMW65_12990 [Chloroflexota bacterium]|nr:hypothetical protein [Chloroflexota bacterium]